MKKSSEAGGTTASKAENDASCASLPLVDTFADGQLPSSAPGAAAELSAVLTSACSELLRARRLLRRSHIAEIASTHNRPTIAHTTGSTSAPACAAFTTGGSAGAADVGITPRTSGADTVSASTRRLLPRQANSWLIAAERTPATPSPPSEDTTASPPTASTRILKRMAITAARPRPVRSLRPVTSHAVSTWSGVRPRKLLMASAAAATAASLRQNATGSGTCIRSVPTTLHSAEIGAPLVGTPGRNVVVGSCTELVAPTGGGLVVPNMPWPDNDVLLVSRPPSPSTGPISELRGVCAVIPVAVNDPVVWRRVERVVVDVVNVVVFVAVFEVVLERVVDVVAVVTVTEIVDVVELVVVAEVVETVELVEVADVVVGVVVVDVVVVPVAVVDVTVVVRVVDVAVRLVVVAVLVELVVEVMVVVVIVLLVVVLVVAVVGVQRPQARSQKPALEQVGQNK
mmetsp:Transcript_29221/g.82991  ORF Transcript_29221/g.82991 Transcript_29221/m.82991 type:complete len:457 (-) Transcript_29221:330-1700(-)